MKALKVRAAGVALVSVALAGLGASPALAAPGVTVGSLSSLQGGRDVRDAGRSGRQPHRPRGQRQGHGAHPAHAAPPRSSSAHTAVRVAGQRRGAVLGRGQAAERPAAAATTTWPRARRPGPAPATSAARRRRRTSGSRAARRCAAAPAQLPARRKGAQAAGRGLHLRRRTRSPSPATRVYPEIGNGGYASVHSDVFINYDALDEPVPAGHARRPAAALDAVPERLQPRLRRAQHVTTHGPPRGRT